MHKDKRGNYSQLNKATTRQNSGQTGTWITSRYQIYICYVGTTQYRHCAVINCKLMIIVIYQ